MPTRVATLEDVYAVARFRTAQKSQAAAATAGLGIPSLPGGLGGGPVIAIVYLTFVGGDYNGVMPNEAWCLVEDPNLIARTDRTHAEHNAAAKPGTPLLPRRSAATPYLIARTTE